MFIVNKQKIAHVVGAFKYPVGTGQFGVQKTARQFGYGEDFGNFRFAQTFVDQQVFKAAGK